MIKEMLEKSFNAQVRSVVTKIHRPGFQNFFKMFLATPYLFLLKKQALKLTGVHKPLCYL